MLFTNLQQMCQSVHHPAVQQALRCQTVKCDCGQVAAAAGALAAVMPPLAEAAAAEPVCNPELGKGALGALNVEPWLPWLRP